LNPTKSDEQGKHQKDQNFIESNKKIPSWVWSSEILDLEV
jgi:hypothetical protein